MMETPPKGLRAPIETPLTYEDVAKLLHVDKTTVRRMVADGEWPAPFRIGKQWRWLPSTVRDYLAALEMVQRLKKRGEQSRATRSKSEDSETSDSDGQKPTSRKKN